MGGYYVSPEQQSLLQNHTFSLRPLATVGHLSIWRTLLLTWQPIAIFVVTTIILSSADLRYKSPGLAMALCAIFCVILLAYRAIAFGVLAFGIAAARTHSKVRWSAVVYWTWWPFFALAACCVATACGCALGNHLWYHRFLPYRDLQRYQAYQHVDPAVVGGVRLQDAGIVTFNRTAAVDRLRVGCYKQGGTYCVAPIVPGQQKAEQGGAGFRSGQPHDLFMVGVDCCHCPGEFRCGDWNDPVPLGGVREIDPHENSLYRLAAEEWGSAYGQELQHPIFFRWVVEPLAAHREMRDQGRRLLLLGLLIGPCAFMFLVAVLNGLLGLIVDAKYAAPIEVPLPSRGIGRKIGEHFLPAMNKLSAERDPGQPSGIAPDPKYVCL